MANLSGIEIAGRYRVISLVASGGMASVYLAEDNVLDREVALKVIHPHLAGDKSFVDKFRREAKVAARLSHPNLVNVYDQGSDGEIIFLVMEYVPGITLRDAMNDFGALDANRTLEIIEPLTAGLAAAHAAGILHRDLKPENVFLSDGGTVKLGDFGLARAITQQTQTESVVGTVAYLSPELVLRGQADARSDIYSLGVMIFEMLTGRAPYEGEQAVQIAYQHANSRIPAPSSLKPTVPELLDEIVLWTTAREASHRPATAEALLPVIKRARADLLRGLATRLDSIADTQTLSVGEGFVAPVGSTEVLSHFDFSKILDEQPESARALKLQRSTKRGGILVALLTLLAIFGGAGAGWWLSTGPGGLATIPELTGRTIEVATKALSPLGLEIETLSEHSLLVAEGLVVRTDPPSGSRVFKNTPLTIYLSLGPRQLEVPGIQGLDLEKAQALLLELGFVAGDVKYFFHDEPNGQVFKLSRNQGEKINEGSVLDLLVSLGPLPELSGLASLEAKELLSSLDVVVVEEEVFNNEIAAGLTVSLIADSNPLPKGGSVTLQISKGPEIVIMPNVVGETIAAAKNLLQNLGFEVVIDTNQLSSNFGIAKVKRQDPAVGSELRLGDSVTLISR
jgi:serine/threonine-protein kinase